MKISYLNGPRLKRGIIAGARRVIQMQEALNSINVFPVPDNDTGTNMALTMQSVAEGVIECRDLTVGRVSQAAADSALLGARGNSGAILAQFFQGLADGLRDKARVKVQHFVDAAGRAADAAYEAIAHPQEGTILTVIREWVQYLRRERHASDFADLLRNSIQVARESLSHTPEKLRVLAAAGVVDAGAEGFVHLLEGINHFIESGTIEQFMGTREAPRRAHVQTAPEQLHYRYCAECLLEGDGINRLALRRDLSECGGSLIVAGSDSRVRIHIHTNEPQLVLERAQKYGAVVKTKADDMRRQHEQAHSGAPPVTIAVVTDSSCDLPPEFLIRHNVQMVPIQVSFGYDRYIDKITLTPKQFYRLLVESPYHPTTSQPAPADFLRIYEQLVGRYEHVISVHLSGSLSGTLQAAATAASRVQGIDIRVVDSKMASVGLGLMVAEAVRAVEEGCGIDEVVRRVEVARKQTRLYVGVATMEYLVRGGRVSRTRGRLATLLGLKPILMIDCEGRVVPVAKTRGGAQAQRTILAFIRRDVLQMRKVRFAVAHANALNEAERFAESLRKEFEVRDVMIVDGSPALGAHTGPGAVAAAFTGESRAT